MVRAACRRKLLQAAEARAEIGPLRRDPLGQQAEHAALPAADLGHDHGLAAGSGLFLAATLATAVIWVILALLEPIERRFIQTRNRRPRVSARLGGAPALAAVEEVLSRHHLATFKIILRRHDSGEDIVDILFERSVRTEQLAMLVDSLRQVEGLRSVSYAAAGESRIPPPA